MSLSRSTRPDFFERHIRRLAWYALLATVALLVPITRFQLSPDVGLLVMIAAVLLVGAVFAVIRDVGRYVRYEHARRKEAVEASRRAGAYLAATTIHDRVANLLSLTVGYVGIVAEDQPLTREARDQVDRAIEAAISAARLVSTYKQSLECAPGASIVGNVLGVPLAASPTAGPDAQPHGWSYDPRTRRVLDDKGVLVATVASEHQVSPPSSEGQLIAAAPDMWELLADAQRLGISLLATGSRSRTVEAEIRDLVDRINAITDQVQS